MLCYPNFPGDEDKRLFDIQAEAYGEALWVIVNAARERHLDAERVLRCSITVSLRVQQLKAIDHRTIQDIHDLTAAWFRFKRRTERMFPIEGDLRWEWIKFIKSETTELCKSADFVNGVLDACIYPNTDCGYAGEKRAQAVQRSRYAEMFHYRPPQPESPANSG